MFARFRLGKLSFAMAAAGALFLGGPALPISHVGNSSIESPSEGFGTSIAPAFCGGGSCLSHKRQETGELILFTAKIYVSSAFGSIPAREQVWLRPFSRVYSELSGMEREALREYFLSGSKEGRSPFKEFPESVDTCVEAFLASRGSSVVGVATWGKGRGVVFSGKNISEIQAAIRSMMRDLELRAGACAWR